MTIAVVSMIRDSWGGSEELWYRMAKIALAEGHKVVHLGYEHPQVHPKMQELQQLGLVSIKRPGWIPSGASKSKRMFQMGFNYLRKRIQKPVKKVFSYRPDVVLYNGTCYSIAREKELLDELQKEHNRNIAFYIIGQLNNDLIRTINEREAAIVQTAYKRCTTVFFASERNLESARRHLYTNIENGAVIKNPVNISTTEPIPFPPTKGPIQIALVANLITMHKGQDLLLHCLSEWKEKDWELHIYGNGPDKEYLVHLTDFLGLSDKTSFLGNEPDILRIWEKNHVLIMSSHMEGMPLAVMEAMLCARICIVTDVGGHREWITDGANGFIVESPSIVSLTKALDRAWSRKSEWESIAMEAHQTASHLFDKDAGRTLLQKILHL